MKKHCLFQKTILPITMINKDWQKVSFEEAEIEIIDGDRGKNYPHGSEFLKNDFCLFLNAKNVTNTGFNFDEKMFISKEKESTLRKGKLQKYDIVLTTRGTVGNVAYFNDSVPFKNIRINSGMIIFRANTLFYNPNFLYYLIKSDQIQQQISSCKTGSAQPQLPISIIKKLNFLSPSPPEQKAIAATLSCLDDMIELNNQTNKILEEIVQAIFKRWFVDFEFPDENGQPYQSSSGEMIESELGPIPKGWRVVELGEVTINNRTKTESNNYQVLSAVNTGNLILSEDYFTKQVYSKDQSKYVIVKKNEFAYNPARVNIGSIGMNEYDFDGCVSPVYVVFKTEENYHWFFKMFIKTEIFKNEVLKRASGSVRQVLNYRDFELIKMIYPRKEIIEKFNLFFDAYYLTLNEISREIEILSSIRDSLLPKLMSGEIRVPIEEVLLCQII